MENFDLRQKAEEILRKKGVTNMPVLDGDFEKLIHELAVYHIELEYQNDELRKIQDELYESREEYADLFNTAPVGYIVMGSDGTILRVNDTVCALIDAERRELLSARFSNYIHPDCQDGFYFFIQELKKNGHAEVTLRVKQHESEIKFIQIIGKLARSKQSETLIRMSVIDITTQRKLEIELTEAKNNAIHAGKLKSAFISNLNHEVRTPMNAISGFSNLLMRNNFSPVQQLEFIDIIKQSSNQLLKIMDSILELSEFESGSIIVHPANFYICDVLDEVYGQFKFSAQEKHLEFILIKPEKEAPLVYSDSSKIQKILTNLIDNALKFTERGLVEIGCREQNNEIVVYVKDSGIGIAPGLKERVFESFMQEDSSLCRKYGGLGIGLSLVRENARILNLNIQIDTEKNKGTVFSFPLPIVKPQKSEYQTTNANRAMNQAQIVLVVEDEELNHLYINAVISEVDKNIQLLHAANGREAYKYSIINIQ